MLVASWLSRSPERSFLPVPGRWRRHWKVHESGPDRADRTQGALRPCSRALARGGESLRRPRCSLTPALTPADLSARRERSSRSASTTATARACTSSGTRCSTPSSGPRARMLEAFEQRWAEWNGLPSLGPLELGRRRAGRARVRRRARRDRALPLQHLHGDAARGDQGRRATGQFVDCNRDDLCMSFEDFEAQGRAAQAAGGDRSSTSAATSPSTSSGSPTTAAPRGIFLLEDCAHAHGAELARPPAGHLGRRRRLLALRDEDDLHRRGRRARLRQPGADRVRRARSATTASPTTRSTASTTA